jgi:hypothetical protein
VLRLALIVLAALIALLIALALLPGRERAIPDMAIRLEDATLTLYPRADPEAVWRFDAPEVAYWPESRETTLYRISDGARLVNGETDFTLASEEVTIDRDDNLRGDAITAHLVEEESDLFMTGKFERQVFINQQAGQFEIPHLELKDDFGEGIYENMRISFDLTEFRAGGVGTVGYSEFDIGTEEQP